MVANCTSISQAELDQDYVAFADCYETVNAEGRTAIDEGLHWRLAGFGEVHRSGHGDDLERQSYWVGNIIGGGPSVKPLDSIDGQFALVQIAPAVSEVTVATDPFGMYGLYHYQDSRKSYFSTSPIAVALHLGLELDELGVKSYLRTGSLFGRRTLFRGLNRLMPAEFMTCSPTSFRTGVYWNPLPDCRISDLRFKHVVPKIAEVVSGSLKSSLADFPPLATDLTGGFDTRTLCLILENADLDFDAITDGNPASPDATLAREIATLKGWNWVSNPVDPVADRMLSTRSAIAWGGGGLEAIQLGDILSLHSRSPLRGRLRLGAGAGEIARDFFWIQEMSSIGRTNKVKLDRLINLRLMGPTDLRAFSVDPTGAVWEELRDSLLERSRCFNDQVNTFQLDVLYAFKCRGHYGAYLSATAGQTSQVLPFLFRDLFVSFTSVKPRYRLQHHFQGALIQFFDERLAQLRTTRGGPALPYSLRNVARQLPYFAEQGMNLGRRAMKKHGAKLSRKVGSTLQFEGRGDSDASCEVGESDEWFELIRYLFGTNLDRRDSWAVGDQVSLKGFEQLVQGARAGSELSRSQLARLATVEGASRMARGEL